MSLAKPITPHLWFDTQANEAAEFYCSVFPDSRIDTKAVLRNTPSGDCDVLHFHLCGQPFMAISAGPLFKFNPSVSFFVHFDPSRDPQAREKLDALWDELAHGGTPLMGLDAYPFSERYGWVQDRYGVSWQLILTNPDSEPRPTIVPSLLFTGAVCGKAKKAGEFYRTVFDDSQAGRSRRIRPACRPIAKAPRCTRTSASATTWFAAMDNAHEHKFRVQRGDSFLVAVPRPGGNRAPLGKPSSDPQVRAMRLAQGPLRRVVAGHADRDGRDHGLGRPGDDRPRRAGTDADAQDRPCDPRSGGAREVARREERCKAANPSPAQ